MLPDIITTHFFGKSLFAGLERITYTEVKCGVLPTEIVNPSLALGAVGVVNLNTPVQTQDYECNIDTKAQACIHTQLLVELVEVEYSVGR